MGYKKVLFVVLFFGTMTKGFTHIGQPCNIIRICLARHSHCDSENICRCDSNYPVEVAPHTCKKGRRHGEECRYKEECQYFDTNSYCHDLYYKNTCECFTGFSYSKSTKLCEPVNTNYRKPPNLILPTAIGFSLVFAGVLCCCMIMWRFCRRQTFAHISFLPRNNIPTPNSPHHQSQIEGQNAFLSADETLPNYDTVINLKSSEDEEECEPPPSYDEVIGNAHHTSKV